MAATSGKIPNLIGGVNQQPGDIRPINTADLLDNVWLSPSFGLGTRPELRYVGTFGETPAAPASCIQHNIEKPSGTYQVTVTDGVLEVMNTVTGALDTVSTTAASAAYVAAGDDNDLGFVTIGDTTFIYNKSVTCTATTDADGTALTGNTDETVTRLNPNRHATMWIKQRATSGDFVALYKNGTLLYQRNYSDDVDDVITAFANNTSDDTRVGLSILSYTTLETDVYQLDDSAGNTRATLFSDFLEEFTDLPPNDREGRLVLIRQDPGDTSDDYWVWYIDGAWQETYGWNAYELPDPATMPMILVDNLDGTWDLSATTWPGRTTGDTDSNPTPSFVDNKINNMFLYKGRMAILTGENLVTSRVQDFENFYRSTCSQLLDDDPIDIASPQSRGASLYHAEPFGEELLLFSPLDQFKVSGDGDGLFSPNTVEIGYANQYQVDPNVTPVPMAANVLFVEPQGTQNFSSLREYQVERTFGTEVAISITDGVSEYIPSGIYRMAHSPSDSLVAVVTSGDPDVIFMYHYYYNNQGKVMSSWTRWTLPGNVHDISFEGDRMMVLLDYESELIQCAVVFNEEIDAALSDDSVLLDLKVTASDTTVAFAAGDTTVALPYTPTADTVLVISPTDADGTRPQGSVITPSSMAGKALVFEGVDLSGADFLCGNTYDFTWKLNPFYKRDKEGVPIQDGRLQMRATSMYYTRSGSFTVTSTAPRRTPVVRTYSGTWLGTEENVLGELQLTTGKALVSTKGKGEEMTVVVSSTTPYRVRFTSVEWYGSSRPKRSGR